MLLDPVGRWGSIGRVTKSSFPKTAIADLISLQLHNLTEPARANIQLNSGLHCESQFVTVDLFNDWDPDDDDSENDGEASGICEANTSERSELMRRSLRFLQKLVSETKLQAQRALS